MRTCFLTLLSFFLLVNASIAQIDLGLVAKASGFDRPVDIKHAGDDRIFVVEQRGTIKIINGDGEVLPVNFLDIDSRVNSGASERGLLGLAFHPSYASNGYFYVNYTDNSGTTTISRFSVNTANPNIADVNSELKLMQVSQPFSNHNAGDMAFGPDGYLYITMGDGGAGGDPGNRAQNRQDLLGKLLRIDVNSGNPYAIPADNPFANDDETLDEIWALGLRNPWRISFDRQTGDLWIGDVGQDNWEEIDFQPANSAGGENYGWRCKEGLANYSGCSVSDLTEPVHVYNNTPSVGCSVTGGYVYRGGQFPDMAGHYIYADYCSGRFWSLYPDGNGGFINTDLANLSNNQYSAFGEDKDGELYVAALGQGTIYQVVDETVSSTPEALGISRFMIAPNPFHSQIHLELAVENGAQIQLQLLDVNGQLLYESIEQVQYELVKDIDTNKLPSGVYILRIQMNGKEISQKVYKI